MATTTTQPTAGDVTFVMLTPSDRLDTARDFLRGRESDYYRVWLSSSASDPTRDDRLGPLAAEIKRIQDEVSTLESQVGGSSS